MLDLYVVAHPEATHHVQGRVGGWHDSELTVRGVRQSALVADALGREVSPGPRVALYTSDLTRTVQTADAIAARLGTEVTALPELREKSYGEGEGKPDAWFRSRFIPPPRVGNRLRHDEGLEGGETKIDWILRVYRGMELVCADPAPTKIVVTHGGSASPVVAHWLRLPADSLAYAAFRVEPGSITHLREDDRFHNRTLMRLNDREHLRRA